MAALGGLLVLLALVLSVCSIVGAISPKLFSRLSKDGKIPSRLFLFFGFNVAAMLAMGIGASMLPTPPNNPPQTAAESPTSAAPAASLPDTEATEDDVSEPEENVAAAEENRVEFDFDFPTLRNRINADFKSVQSSYRIPSNIHPQGDENAYNLTTSAVLSDNLSFITSITPTTQKVNGIMVLYVPGDSNNIQILNDIMTASFIVAAADGDNGNKTVGGKIITMVTDAVKEFTDNGADKSVNRKFVFNNTEYTVLVAKGMPITLAASPKK